MSQVLEQDQEFEAQDWPFERSELLGEIQHGITDRRITCSIYRGRLLEEASEITVYESPEGANQGAIRDKNRGATLGEPTGPGNDTQTGWFTIGEIAALPLAASARKAFVGVLGVDLTRG